ncbi:DeoR/GlpR family DNA-binding transcription regulator [Sphingomonas psychrotolerans]|uniref:DeoR/GlpR family DNA-binding transcription regulator n=1 Tax=Sphingomonas psychrotolerans TaxID=1327635 RepID=UPI001F2C9CB9|nr:DeoR/GlpR family DNA-binding transcription regulator [Sphingomonas psychrotolerans]
MIQSTRLATILDLLEERRSCSITELARQFAVSEETIRRDVKQLEASGRVYKVHGGVRLPDNLLEAPYRLRLGENADAKRAIAARAASLVEDGMTVLIDSGTSAFWFARALAQVRGLTIVTNSLEVAQEVLGRNDTRLFLAGGAMNVDYRAGFGAEAIAYSRGFAPDICVLSMGAIEAERGFLDFEPEEAAYKRALLDRPRRVMVLADASKFAREGTVHVAGFEAVDDLVTDRSPPVGIVQAAEGAGTRIHVTN